MAGKGAAPQPTKLRILRGNPGKRAINKREPQPRGIPSCPAWLNRIARAEWRRIAPELERLGLITDIDMAALAAYCDCYSLWQQTRLIIREQGIADSDGLKATAATRLLPQILTLMKSYLAEFGMSPAARTRIQTADRPEKDMLDAILS